MAVQLTRKQYEELYGSKPVFTKPDTTFEPTPIRMTRAEYDRLYPKKQYEAPRGLGIKETALAGIENIKTGIQKTFGAAEAARPEPEDNIFDEGVARGTLETLFRGLRAGTESVVGLGRTVGGVAQVGLSPVLGPLNIAGEKIGQTIGRALPVGVGSAAEGVTKSPIAMQSLEDILDLSNLAVPEFAARGAKALEPVQKAIEIKLQSGELTPPQVKTFFEDRVSQQALKDLQDLKTKNAKLRNNQFFDDESIQRIADAQAKTGILNNATDYDGTIRIKESGIAQKYRELTIDGADGVVKQLLKREGAKVNVEEIASAMRVAADLKYEGADLINALRGIEKELVGLRKRADEFGDVPLDKVQDMKIASTQYVDYTKPAAASFKKLKGSVYRQIIEDKSNTTIKINGKDKTVKDINAELQKYYRDIENLEALDGLKVKGARLGKYFSQAIGALIGSSAGQIAGPLGSAIGGVIGAEAGGALRGAQLARSFGRGRSGEIAPNTLLQKAKEAGKKDAVVDLRKPDLKVGAPTNVPKTKEIRQVEARIARNVEEQKKAIASKDYTLVATLKEVYKALVEKLKELIEKATTGSVRGFARLDLGQSKSEGSRKIIQASNKGKTSSSTGVNDTTSFQGFPDLSTKLLEKLKGRTTVSRQFIEDLSNSPDLKQAERDLIRRVLGEGDIGAIPSKLVHFTDAKNLKSIEKNGLRPTKASEGTITDGISLATKRTEANEIFGNAKVNVYVRPNAKSISLKDALDEMGYGSETDLGVIKNIERQAPKWARENGYDILDMRDARGAVYKGMDEIRVLNPDAISTKPFAGSDQISVPDFANKVKSELLPLTVPDTSKMPKAGFAYEHITLPDELRGPIANYNERIYESPIKNSAGNVHFRGASHNYFAHTRIEDLPDNTRQPDRVLKIVQGTSERRPFKVIGDGVDQNFATKAEAEKAVKDFAVNTKNEMKTRRVIELQSDLFQKGRLNEELALMEDARLNLYTGWKNEIVNYNDRQYDIGGHTPATKKYTLIDRKTGDEIDVPESVVAPQLKKIGRESEVSKLEPYRNTWHERVIREEVKQAALDGKTKLQFPTGETAMKIEGLGVADDWYHPQNPKTEVEPV